ncbi:MAG: response regulator [Planctomycetota bacterium]|jgi:CheY-like chemotaxis protein
MTATRPRLLVVDGASPLAPGQLEALKSVFEVVHVEDAGTAARMAEEEPRALVLGPLAGPRPAPPAGGPAAKSQEPLPAMALAALRHIGEGVGVVDASGALAWANARLTAYPAKIRKRFVELCVQALTLFNQPDEAAGPVDRRHSKKFNFESGSSYYELVASPASVDEGDRSKAAAVVGVLWDVTATRQLQNKIDAIDAAGSELMKIESVSISQLNMAERLKLLEDKIVHFVHDLLNFDNFELRLLDRRTNQLELVLAVGISPLKIGEVMYAEPEGNGISGYVAATGRSYICPNVRKDPRYREGLDNAATSMTVPLRLHDRVIGVFNIESNTPNVFDEDDRQFAEIFGRYIAMAMNILDLLVVERYRTNERPLETIAAHVEALRSATTEKDALRREVDQIMDAVKDIRTRIEACAAGPRTILGAEQELRRHKPDPGMVGKRVLVAEDELAIRESVKAILSQKGCQVTVCETGDSATHPFDLVISDIKMPDRTGYEVFRAAKEVCADTPVILMTGFGYDPHHSIIRASQEGLHSFLFKPFKESQLLEMVTKVFAVK